MSYPKYTIVNGTKYEIDTDFRTAIRCQKIATDDDIEDTERALGILYTLYGDIIFEDGKEKDWVELAKKSKLYLSCGKELENDDEEPDMDFEQDMEYIEASFMSDFHIDLENTKMHWWKFIKLMNGLSNSELGNCCVLSNVRNLRNFDVSKVEDKKERDKIIKAQERVALKKKPVKLTEKEEESVTKFYELTGIERK